MRESNMLSTRSFWREVEAPTFDHVAMPREVDVVVVGAGITGLTTAYLLKRAGKRVAVFDREGIGSGETGNTSAHLTHVTDLRLHELSQRFGTNAARLVWQAGAAAIDAIERTALELRISCDFRRVPGMLCAPFDPRVAVDFDSSFLRREAAAAEQIGFDARCLESGPFTGGPAIGYPDQALFHPLKYLAGLARAIDGEGSIVAELAEVGSVLQDPLAVIVNGETVACHDVVIATHVPIAGSSALTDTSLLQTKLYPYSSYVVSGRIEGEPPEIGLYWDTSDPYYYLRIHEGGGARRAIFGGNDHKTGHETDTTERFESLELALRSLIPSARVDHRWTGQVVETDDGLPFIGTTAEHQYAATGFGGNGLTFGTVAAMMICDAITGLPNPCRDLFDPHRKPTSRAAIGRWVGENVDFPYYLVTDRVRTAFESGGVDAIRPGEGKVVRVDGRPAACYRAPNGRMIKVSATCTHLGCLVRWNDADATWDCPCHGSRFTPEGFVIGGPAESPLERLDGD